MSIVAGTSMNSYPLSSRESAGTCETPHPSVQVLQLCHYKRDSLGPGCCLLTLVRWQFVGVDFQQSQTTIGDVLGFIQPMVHLYGTNQKIAGDRKGEVAMCGGLEGATDDRRVVDTGDGGRDIDFRTAVIEQFDGDSRKGSGSRIS